VSNSGHGSVAHQEAQLALPAAGSGWDTEADCGGSPSAAHLQFAPRMPGGNATSVTS